MGSEDPKLRAQGNRRWLHREFGGRIFTERPIRSYGQQARSRQHLRCEERSDNAHSCASEDSNEPRNIDNQFEIQSNIGNIGDVLERSSKRFQNGTHTIVHGFHKLSDLPDEN